jgi:UDP-N-acetylglucosamine 1-carboxyvinyltransferase
MDRIVITGGKTLHGSITISGAKNAALPLMAASILTSESIVLANVPHLADIMTMAHLLINHGVSFSVDGVSLSQSPTGRVILLNGEHIKNLEAPYDIVRKMRASILVLGPLVARFGYARVSLPGGCAIGARPIDLHLSALKQMGAEVELDCGYIEVKSKGRLKGAEIHFNFVSVGATENILMAATLAEGRTILHNVAREPEISDLIKLLNAMGAKIEGLGTPLITITGVEKMHPTNHATIADRIVTGTWAFAAAMTQGDITINGARAQDLEIPLEKLTAAGAIVTSNENSIRVRMDSRPKAIDVSTLPYPGFPTDLQPMVITLNAIATGDAIVTENVFEGRFMFVNELIRLGAQITIDGHHAAITGVEKLSSAPVVATDIRAGAGLVLAGLVSDGITFVEDGYHIDRGYPDFAKQLRALGADVTREL